MKKNYLLIAAAAALFAACAQTDTIKDVDTQDVAIGFSTQGVNKTTRAEMTMDWLKTVNNSFGVYGFKGVAGVSGTTNLFTNEEVKYQSVTPTGGTAYNDWRHETVRFWDKNSNAYNFYAYAPYNAYNVAWDNTKGFSFSGIPVIQLIDNSNNNSNEDLVVAAAQENYSYAQCATDHTNITAGHPVHDDPSAGYVPFIFHHILSKLSFNVKTHADYSNTAVFTVKEIRLNFPSLDESVANYGVAWNENSKDDVDGTTVYTGYTTAETTSIVYETEVYNNATGVTANSTAQPIGNAFIVTPKNGTVTGHAFGIKVTYDVQYKKLNPAYATDNTVDQYINDVKEEDCVATGTIAATTYTPSQNEWWTITIDINPESIQFCADKVESWTTDLNGDANGDGQPDPVDVK